MMVLPLPGSSASRISERLAGQHLLVDRRDLMRERFDQRGVDGEHRIEEVGHPESAWLPETRRNIRPSPSKLHGRPDVATSRVASRSR